MTTAENIALIAEHDSATQFRPMFKRANAESISIEDDEYEGCNVSIFTFSDGSRLQVCSGHMEAL